MTEFDMRRKSDDDLAQELIWAEIDGTSPSYIEALKAEVARRAAGGDRR